MKKFYFQIVLNYLNKKKINKRIHTKQYISLGSGLSNYLYKNKLIVNYNQKHWYIINLPKNVLILLIRKRKNLIYSNNILLLNQIFYTLKKLKKFNYYKAKGFALQTLKKRKIVLKENEKTHYN